MESPKRLFWRWWLLSERVCVILQVPTLWRMGKMRMMKRQHRASWAKMVNLAGWWAQSPKWYSSTWRGFGQSRWSLTNCNIRVGRRQRSTSVKVIRSMTYPNWGFQQLLNCKRIMMLLHLHRQHSERLWSVLTLSPGCLKCRNRLLDWEVVISGQVLGSRHQTQVFLALRPPLHPIHHSFRMQSLLNL